MLYAGVLSVITGLALMFEDELPFGHTEDLFGTLCFLATLVVFFTFIAFLVTLVKSSRNE